MALFLSVDLGDRIRIGESTITFEKKTGRKVRVRIDSSEDLHVDKAGGTEKPEPPAAPQRQPAPATPVASQEPQARAAAAPLQLRRNGLTTPR